MAKRKGKPTEPSKGHPLRRIVRDRKALTANEIIKLLEQKAEKTKLMPGTRLARETMQIEMDGLIIDSLNLKRGTKTRLHSLVAKRMRILQMMAELEHKKTMDIEAALIVFRDEKNQLTHRQKFLVGKASPERRAQLHATLREQIALLEQLKALGQKTVSLSNRKTQQGILAAANLHNILIRNLYLGKEIDRFEHLRNDIRDRFLNQRFP